MFNTNQIWERKFYAKIWTKSYITEELQYKSNATQKKATCISTQKKTFYSWQLKKYLTQLDWS